MLLHDAQELDNDLGAGTDQDLALASLLGIVDSVKRIVEDGSLDHFDVWLIEILRSKCFGNHEMRYLERKSRTHSSKSPPNRSRQAARNSGFRKSQPPVVFERKECPFEIPSRVLQLVPWERCVSLGRFRPAH